MTGHQRITKVMQGSLPDRIPIMLHSFMTAASESGYSMKQFREDPNKIASSLIRFADKYKLDGILVDVDTALLAGACGAKVDYPENEPARVVAPSGESIEEIIDRINLKEVLNNERIQIYLEALRIISSQCKGEIFVRGNADQGPFGLAFLVYGMENFLVDLVDEEKENDIFALLDRCYEVCLEFHKEVFSTGVDCTSFGDSPSGPDLVSPAIYRKFAKPYQKKLAEDLAKHNIKTVCHICGNTDSILEDMVETGCSGFEIDYKTDINKAKDILKTKAVIFGNIDPSGVFALGSVETVGETTKRLIDQCKDGGKFVIGAGCALPPDTPEENIREFVRNVNTYGWYD